MTHRKIEGKRRRGQQRLRWLDGITDTADLSLSQPGEMAKDREACCAAVHGATHSQTRLSKQTATDRKLGLERAGKWFLLKLLFV